MNTLYRQNGYSLIEVLIAISILMLAIVAPMTIAVKSIQSSHYALEQNSATFLAQEAISMVEANRNRYALRQLLSGGSTQWGSNPRFAACQTANGCNFDASDPLIDNVAVVECTGAGEDCRLYKSTDETIRSPYRITGAAEDLSPYTRRIFYTYQPSGDELNVRVVVEWESRFLGQTQSVSLTTALFNPY